MIEVSLAIIRGMGGADGGPTIGVGSRLGEDMDF